MKVCVTGTRGFPGVQGGVETHCEHLYPKLAELGCQVTAFRRTPYLSSDSPQEYRGVKFRDLWCPRRMSLEAIFHTALSTIRAAFMRPDVLHIHAVGPALCVPLARLLGLPVVVTSQGPDYARPKWGKLATRVIKLGERWAARYANRMIVVSDAIRRMVKEEYGDDAEVIPNGVELPEGPIGSDRLDQWGLEPGRYVFALGRFVEEKGFDHLLEAYRGLDTEWKLALAGDADHPRPHSRYLRRTAEEMDKVVLTGMVKGKDLQQLYANCGLMVLPSHHEGLPLVLLEALSYGCNVIASDIPACRAVPLREERYVPDGDETALRQKMEHWMAKGISQTERQENLDLLRREYDWGTIARRTLAVYREVVGDIQE